MTTRTTRTTSGFSPVPVALGSASTETEEGRAFFQDRLRLYTGWVFVLASGFYLLSAVNVLPLGVRVLVEPGNIFHFLACLTIGSVWLITRQVSCSWQRLLLLEHPYADVLAGSRLVPPADPPLDVGDRVES